MDTFGQKKQASCQVQVRDHSNAGDLLSKSVRQRQQSYCTSDDEHKIDTFGQQTWSSF